MYRSLTVFHLILRRGTQTRRTTTFELRGLVKFVVASLEVTAPHIGTIMRFVALAL